MDGFEKNIRDNKGFFDEKAPNKLKMWDQIEADLNRGDHNHDDESNTGSAVMGILLAGLVLIGLVLGGIYLAQNANQDEQVLMANAKSSELNDIDTYYTKLVSHQIEKLEANEALSSIEKEDFMSYIEELNAEQTILKQELQKNINNAEILEAIIDNFNQQVKLIEQLLNRINHEKNIENETGIFI